MGRAVNLSPLGLYNWDDTIFDLMQIPEALDKDTLVQNLLAETAELEVLYPNPVVFKNLLGVWSAKQIDIWNRLYATTQYEYNPIENYNRYEEGTDTGTGSTTHSGTDTDTIARREGGSEDTESSSQYNTGGADNVTGTQTAGHWIAGYDAPAPAQGNDGLVKQTRDNVDNETVTTYGKTETGTGDSTTTFGKTEDITQSKQHGERVTTANDGEHTLHAHGNIGVTTTQKMIKEQRQVDLFNLYDIIIEDFKMRFCILVY